MASEQRDDAEGRRRGRAGWPVAHFRLGEEPGDDISELTTPEQRVAMMAELAEAAWRMAGRSLPSYRRSEMPGRLFRAGESRSDDDDT